LSFSVVEAEGRGADEECHLRRWDMGGCQQQQQQLLDFASGDSGCFIVISFGAAAMTDVLLRRRRRHCIVVASTATGSDDDNDADADTDLARRASVVGILATFILLYWYYTFDLCRLSLSREGLVAMRSLLHDI